MAVTITNTTKERLDKKIITKAVEVTLKAERAKGNVSVVVVSSRRMKTLNKVYRGKDKVTDVLSFREAEADVRTPHFLGEVIINLEAIKKQAKEFAPSTRFELAFIVIHGVLHLLGYDDKTAKEAAMMEKLGNSIIKKVL